MNTKTNMEINVMADLEGLFKMNYNQFLFPIQKFGYLSGISKYILLPGAKAAVLTRKIDRHLLWFTKNY